MLWNLLANALKFTPAGGHVEARLQVEGNEAVIRITDDGEGIAPEFLPYVFDRFRQETGDITRTHSGLGIGLALVRYLAELHGGSVSAHSSGKGKGSVFSLRLPIVRVVVDKTSNAPAADGSPVERSTLAGLHVLVVDDDADARDVVATALVHAGARVTAVASAAEAIAMAGGDEIHLVLTDIAMPNDSGYDLLLTLRGNPRTARAPIVAITGRGHVEDREQPLAAGFDGHVGKPFEPAYLVELLATLAGRTR